MVTPTFADYVDLLFTCLNAFSNVTPPVPSGVPFVYGHKFLIMFFIVMDQRRIFRLKAQYR